jgi:pyruvate/2-oxoglutarate dehydrogenase complex dihydrolipoamide dehydrogenase (E3) component
MTIEHFENLVIGSGVAGKILAWTLGKEGQKTVVVERSMIGGSCVNVACLPSKNVIYSAKAISLVHPTKGLGVVTGSLRVDMVGVARRKRQVVDGVIQLHLNRFKASGAELVMGEAQFTEPKTVRVTVNGGGMRVLRGERVFLDVGTRASVPDVPGLHIAGPMTHVEALNLQRLPDHLVILGGGYVGLEFAQAMRRFGSRVTIIQRGPPLLEREDPDVAEALLELMTDEGVEVLLEAEILNVTGRSGTGVGLRVRSETAERTLEASDILVATGYEGVDRCRRPHPGFHRVRRGSERVNGRCPDGDAWPHALYRAA